MRITEYFSSDEKEHLLGELKKCSCDAGKMLYELLTENKAKSLLGESTKVYFMLDEDRLVSFCTLSEKDDIQPTELTPWIGFVYTSPKYRGRRLAGELISHAENEAIAAGYDRTYISTNHTGLYEKYGYSFYGTLKDILGENSRVYIKTLKEQ